MYLTNIDITHKPIDITSFNSAAAREYLATNSTATLTVTLTSDEDYQNLQAMLGKNIQLVEIPYTMERAVNVEWGETGMFRRYTNVIGDSTGGVKTIYNRILKPGPEPIKVRTVTSAIKELEINE
jgi:hypothetical protein